MMENGDITGNCMFLMWILVQLYSDFRMKLKKNLVSGWLDIQLTLGTSHEGIHGKNQRFRRWLTVILLPMKFSPKDRDFAKRWSLGIGGASFFKHQWING